MPILDTVKLNDGAITLKLRNKVWHLHIRLAGKLLRETTGCSELESAKAHAYGRYDDMRLILKEGGTIEKAPTVAKLYPQFVEHLEQEYKKNKSQQYKTTFEKYFLFQWGNTPLNKITEFTLIDWYKWRITVLTPKGTEPKSSTLNNNLVVLKCFFKWCVSQKLIRTRDIPEFPKVKVESARRPAFINGLDKRLIFEARRRADIEKHGRVKSNRQDLYTYIVMGLCSGARSGELASIGLKHLKEIRVKQKGRQRKTYSVLLLEKTKTISGKANHKREAVFLPEVYDVIRLHIRKYEKKGIDLTDRFWPDHESFGRGFDNLLKSMNLKKDQLSGLNFSIYSLRHTYITQRLLAGVTSDIVASQCGTSVKMIEAHYSALIPMLAKNKIVQQDADSTEYSTLDTNFNELFEEV